MAGRWLWLLVALGQAPEATPKPDWMIIARRHAAACSVSSVDQAAAPYKMLPDAVLHRSQEVQATSRGSTFVWMEPSGRPAAICDVFLFRHGTTEYHIGNEWHGLSDRPLQTSWQSQVWLRTDRGGLEWKTLPNAPDVADDAAKRQRQARSLSDRFTAELIDRKGQSFPLRLLTAPLVKYDTTDQTMSLGGALFAFCQQTDPEVLLLLEARREGAAVEWRYALAGFSNMSLYVRLDDAEVWADAPAFTMGRGVHAGGRVRTVNIAAELNAESREPSSPPARSSQPDQE